MRSLLFILFLPLSAVAQLTPTLLTTLSDEVGETSGLMLFSGGLWTHNDAGNAPHIFQIDPENGAVLRTVEISNAPNIDWEDIATDGNYVYIGDVGNNSGARTDLRILRFPAKLLISPGTTSVEVELIEYAYEDQMSFEPANNANDWDCEAIIVKVDSLFLFSKNWVDQQTRLYALPAVPGEHVAQLRAQYDLQGMITGSSYEASLEEVVLVGYTNVVFVPFMVRLSGYTGNSFFNGSVVRETFSLAFVQVEAVEWNGPGEVYLSNEASPFSQQRLWSLSLASTVAANEMQGSVIRLYPNPASEILWVEGTRPNTVVSVHDGLGREVLRSTTTMSGELEIGSLSQGLYHIRVQEEQQVHVTTLLIQR